MVTHTDETAAFNAVLNLAKPDFDSILQGSHPIPGIDFHSRFAKSPLHEDRTAEQIFNWFKEEMKFIVKYVRSNQDNDEIYSCFFDYFQVGPGLKYADFTAFYKDVDWYKLERELA